MGELWDNCESLRSLASLASFARGGKGAGGKGAGKEPAGELWESCGRAVRELWESCWGELWETSHYFGSNFVCRSERFSLDFN